MYVSEDIESRKKDVYVCMKVGLMNSFVKQVWLDTYMYNRQTPPPPHTHLVWLTLDCPQHEEPLSAVLS